MKKLIYYLIISFLLSPNSVLLSQTDRVGSDKVNDGPYIFIQKNNAFKVKWITNNKLFEEQLTPENFDVVQRKFNLLCNYKELLYNYSKNSDHSQNYKGIDSIIVISDLHGKYNNYINLLKSMGVIDNDLNWKFGKGHFVVLGDIFDRGDMVTEILWHLFGLENQAAEAGGKLHVLLGNHEVMVLGNSTGYINEKYKKVEKISKTRYFRLYSKNTVLGSWIRSKPVVISINDILFVHGGISRESVRRNLTTTRTNQIFADKIIGNEMIKESKNEEELFLIQDYGPIWYRGYFEDIQFNENKLDSILHFYDKKHIVVGHTSSGGIISRFNNKLFGIDAGLGNDMPGEVLKILNGIFYKGNTSGKIIKL